MASNDILLFGQGASPNVLAQSAWASSAARTSGFQSGVADSASANKVWRQSNWIAYLLSQWIVDQSGQNIADDGNYANAKTALIAAINALISAAITAGSFATIAALNNEATIRNNADIAEGSARASADSNEATTRNNADSAIYAWTQQNFTQRYIPGGGTSGNFLPGDNFNVPIALDVAAVGLNMMFFFSCHLNCAGPQPGGAYLQCTINYVLQMSEYTSMPMSYAFAFSNPPNTPLHVELRYITSAPGGGWTQCSTRLYYIGVPN